MGDQRLTPDKGEDLDGSSPISVFVLFREELPYYMAMGMTPEEYWHGDVDLPVYYRKAEKIRNSQRNRELWIQGRYFFDAILCAFNPDVNHQYETGYLDEPYPTTKEEAEERQRRIERFQYEKDIALMKARANAWNEKFESEVRDDAGHQ